MGVPEFTVDVFQNEYLPAGGHEVNAVLTVTSAYSAADGPPADVPEFSHTRPMEDRRNLLQSVFCDR
jgi:hypothetical protein